VMVPRRLRDHSLKVLVRNTRKARHNLQGDGISKSAISGKKIW
jgi:hypothetical protein